MVGNLEARALPLSMEYSPALSYPPHPRNLEACGYPREQARWALSRCQGSPRARLNGALDLLLDGGEGGGGSGSGGGSAGTPVSPAKRPLELD